MLTRDAIQKDITERRRRVTERHAKMLENDTAIRRAESQIAGLRELKEDLLRLNNRDVEVIEALEAAAALLSERLPDEPWPVEQVVEAPGPAEGTVPQAESASPVDKPASSPGPGTWAEQVERMREPQKRRTETSDRGVSVSPGTRRLQSSPRPAPQPQMGARRKPQRRGGKPPGEAEVVESQRALENALTVLALVREWDRKTEISSHIARKTLTERFADLKKIGKRRANERVIEGLELLKRQGRVMRVGTSSWGLTPAERASGGLGLDEEFAGRTSTWPTAASTQPGMRINVEEGSFETGKHH